MIPMLLDATSGTLRPFVHVITQFEGLHHWSTATAPDRYLRHAHRHLFVVRLELEVLHDDREIEINAFTRWLNDLIPTLSTHPGPPPDYGSQSCEQLARRIAEPILDRYGHHRQLTCTVLEDGLLGAGVQWHPNPE